MRIIILTSSSSKSGGSRQALYLAQGMQAKGYDVAFFTPDNSTLRSLDPQAPFWRDLGPKSLWRKNVEAALPKDNSPCVAHAFHNAAVKRLAWWGIFWRRHGVVTVAHRGVIFRPNNPLPYWSPGIDCFAPNSKACAAILRRMGVGANRLQVIYNGVPQSRVSPRTDAAVIRNQLQFGPDDFIFGAVAGDSHIKGVEPLLRAFAAARLPHAKLVVLGMGQSKWATLCQELNIASQVRILGHTDPVADYLRAMDAFVLPSLSESMPNTLLEAILMHLPSICSEIGGVPEVLGDSGILVPPGSIDALADALRRMVNDAQARNAMRQAAIKQSPNFTQEKRINTLEALYLRLLAARGLA